MQFASGPAPVTIAGTGMLADLHPRLGHHGAPGAGLGVSGGRRGAAAGGHRDALPAAGLHRADPSRSGTFRWCTRSVRRSARAVAQVGARPRRTRLGEQLIEQIGPKMPARSSGTIRAMMVHAPTSEGECGPAPADRPRGVRPLGAGPHPALPRRQPPGDPAPQDHPGPQHARAVVRLSGQAPSPARTASTRSVVVLLPGSAAGSPMCVTIAAT